MPMLIKELPTELQPARRIDNAGATALNTVELFALLCNLSDMEVAQNLLNEFSGIEGIQKASAIQLCRIDGIGPTKANQIIAAMEIGKRSLRLEEWNRIQVRTPIDIANMMMLEMGELEKEELRVVTLDTKNFVIKAHTIYLGSMNSAVVRIGELFTPAVRDLAASIIIVHNHPSGDPTPSPEDVRVTEMVVEAGRLLDIQVLDHLVIGRNRFISLKERGMGFK